MKDRAMQMKHDRVPAFIGRRLMTAIEFFRQ
jgi:hypothetical protein